MKTTILIAGATGNTGLPLVKQLRAAGVPVRAMIHTPEKRSMVEGSTVEVAVGDFKNRASLEQAMKGIESAYLVSPPALDQVRDQTAFVDAAKAMGVKHIVKLSALGTAPDSPVGLLRWHAEVEDHIRKSGLKYTFLHPHFFMENLLANAGAVKKDGAIFSPLGDALISPVSVEDIAAVALKVLTEGVHLAKTYTLTGPEAVTFADIAWTLGGVIGKPVRYEQVPFDAALKGMVQAGYPDWLAADLIRLMQTWTEGKGSLVSVYVERLTGHKPLSIREFLARHKNLFLAAA
jgi:uncharacterized protein YbjT (DUF2867 family)